LEEAVEFSNVKVFHAGTALQGDKIVTNGGRILGVTAWAKDLCDARDAAYAAVEKIYFNNKHLHFRRDIASKALC
jgi:phosphoribosylamine--glycine ligase